MFSIAAVVILCLTMNTIITMKGSDNELSLQLFRYLIRNQKNPTLHVETRALPDGCGFFQAIVDVSKSVKKVVQKQGILLLDSFIVSCFSK